MKTKAFTFIELMIVIAILAIFGALIHSFTKEKKPRTFERNGHLYFQVEEWNGKVMQWSTPVHDPDCPKCNKNVEAQP